MKEWNDEFNGRRVRHIAYEKQRASLSYFRLPIKLSEWLMFALSKHEKGVFVWDIKQ